MNFLCVIFISGIAACGAQCFTRTCRDNIGTGYEFFDSRSYGGDIHPNPFVPLTRNRQFREFVNQALDCTGQWCYRGKFACDQHGSMTCYHVEHIIDQNGPVGCSWCKSIPGNLIMASGEWNSDVGGLAGRNFTASALEKRFIYGGIYDKALSHIIACCGLQETQDVQPCDQVLCNCDAESDCGCDCDFEILVSTHDLLTAIFALCIAMMTCLTGMSVCICQPWRSWQHCGNPKPKAPSENELAGLV